MSIVHIRRRVRGMLPSPILEKVAAVRHRLDFKMKSRRESPTDYLVEFEHRDIRKARLSILWFDDWDTATMATIQILKDLGVVHDGQTVIDYGCGIGRITKALMENFRVKVYAVERASEMRRHARNYIPAECWQDGSVELLSDQEILDRLPSIQGKVDLLLFIEVFQHIPEPTLDRLIPQLLGTLSPDGKMIVLGNALLDVDRQGNIRKKPVVEVLHKHVEILRHNICAGAQVGESWKQFHSPRHVFLCLPKGEKSSNPRVEAARAP